MKRMVLALAVVAASACTSMPEPAGDAGSAPAFTEEAMSGGRYRIAYTAPSENVSGKLVADRTLARAAEVTLSKGNEWFEIASKVDGKLDGRNTQTLVIIMGKGEALAGGPKQYDARETLASLKGKIS